MVKRPTTDRWYVVSLHKEGLSEAQIVKQTKFERHFVSRWIARFQKYGTVDDKRRSGRKRKLSPAQEAKVEAMVAGKRYHSSRTVAQKVQQAGIGNVSYTTVQRTLHRRGLRAYKRPLTSRLKPDHKKRRLVFATEHKDDEWHGVLFTDEHKVSLFKRVSKQHDQVWAHCRSEVPPREVEAYGMSVNVWAGVWYGGKTPIITYNGTLGATEYQGILSRGLLPNMQQLTDDLGDGWKMMHDMATCHQAATTREWLEGKGVALLEGWPTKGDDFNPIENMWAILDERVSKRNPRTLEGLKKIVKEIWDGISQDIIDAAIDSVRDRIRKVRKAKGGSIKGIK